jgi:predicted nucleic acid-binding protein
MRQFGKRGRQLGVAEHLEIRRRVVEGETFACAAAAVGCSTKPIQRLLIRTGGLKPPTGERSPLPDALQAAAAVHHGLMLATRNTKDFPPRRFDFVVVPYTVAK